MEKARKWLPAILVMSLIFVISSTPGQTIEAAGLGKESLHINGHFILFFILCFSFYKATKNPLDSVIYTILYGFFDEIHQIVTPFRSASFFDIYVDMLGALTAGLILWRYIHIIPKKLKNWLIN